MVDWAWAASSGSISITLVSGWCRLEEDGEDEVVISDEARLMESLIQRYRKIGRHARPLVNSSMPVDVRLAVMLYQLINVDEAEQFITLKLWIHTVYKR